MASPSESPVPARFQADATLAPMIRRALLPSFAALALAACAVPRHAFRRRSPRRRQRQRRHPNRHPTSATSASPAPSSCAAPRSAFAIPAAQIEAVLAKGADPRADHQRDVASRRSCRGATTTPIFIQPKRIDGGRAFAAANREASPRRGQVRRAEEGSSLRSRRRDQLRRQQGSAIRSSMRCTRWPSRSAHRGRAGARTSARRSSATNWRSCSRWARKRASTSPR